MPGKFQFAVCALALFVVACNSTDKDKASDAVTDSLRPIPEATPVERPAPLTGTAAQLEGIWLVEDNNGVPTSVGVNLKANGNAGSINKTDVLYKTWQYLSNDTLVLDGKKRVKNEDVQVSDTFRIRNLTDSVLVLQKGTTVRTYRRA
jgi:hypothetical protein